MRLIMIINIGALVSTIEVFGLCLRSGVGQSDANNQPVNGPFVFHLSAAICFLVARGNSLSWWTNNYASVGERLRQFAGDWRGGGEHSFCWVRPWVRLIGRMLCKELWGVIETWINMGLGEKFVLSWRLWDYKAHHKRDRLFRTELGCEFPSHGRWLFISHLLRLIHSSGSIKDEWILILIQ